MPCVNPICANKPLFLKDIKFANNELRIRAKIRIRRRSTYVFLQTEHFLPLDEAIASRAVFVIVSGSDGRVETLLEPAK